MSRRSWSTRFALWAAVCALLLKAAVPLLATASAEARGVALVEVCTVYGVATVALDGESAPDHPTTHAGEHCVLSAVMALAAPQPAALAFTETAPLTAAPPRAAVAAHDASARWIARQKQGPPQGA